MKKLLKQLKSLHFVTIGILVLAFIGVATVSAEAAVRSASGTAGKFTFVEAIEPQDFDSITERRDICTFSLEYTDMPGMSATFTQGGRLFDSQPVLATLNAQLPGEQFDEGYVRLIVDGTPQAGAGSGLLLDSGGIVHGTTSWNFATAPLTPGQHTVKVQWRKGSTNEQEFCIKSRAMTIFHR